VVDIAEHDPIIFYRFRDDASVITQIGDPIPIRLDDHSILARGSTDPAELRRGEVITPELEQVTPRGPIAGFDDEPLVATVKTLDRHLRLIPPRATDRLVRLKPRVGLVEGIEPLKVSPELISKLNTPQLRVSVEMCRGEVRRI